jgi:hypothetical protein
MIVATRVAVNSCNNNKNNFSLQGNAGPFVFLKNATIVVQNRVAASSSSPALVFAIAPVSVLNDVGCRGC